MKYLLGCLVSSLLGGLIATALYEGRPVASAAAILKVAMERKDSPGEET